MDCHRKASAIGQASWGWRRNWQQQHMFGGNYPAPAWFWNELDNYWRWPPTWLSNHELPGALATQSRSSLEEEDEVVTVAAVDMVFPTHNFEFAYGAEIPVIVDVAVDELVEVHLFLDDGNRSIARMNSYNLEGAFQTGRFTYTLNADPANPEIPLDGNYTLVARAYEVGKYVEADEDPNLGLSGADLVQIEFRQFTGSLKPEVEMIAPIASSITDTSTIYLLATGQDVDGDFEGIQFYVNGEKHGDEVLRPSSRQPDRGTYTIAWTPEDGEGIYSIFAVGRDNSGNQVTSEIYHVTSTTGSTAPDLSVISPFVGVEINDGDPSITNGVDANITIDSTGMITDLVLNQPLGYGYFSAPRVDVVGSGSGAEITAELEWNISSPNYGKIVALTIVDGGTGYKKADGVTLINDAKISIVPTFQSIKEGVKAEIETQKTSNAEGVIAETSYSLAVDISNQPKTGSGYVTMPTLVGPSENASIIQLPLNALNPEQPSSGVAPFELKLDGDQLSGDVEGGFNHAPLFVEFNASSSVGEIVEVFVAVNGKIDPAVKVLPPYVFELLLGDPKEYSIVAYAKDEFGNLTASEPLLVVATTMEGAVPAGSFVGDAVETHQVGSKFVLTASLSSESGINNVEFFQNDISLGFAERQNNSNYFSMIVDLEGLAVGPYEYSFIGRDLSGNQVGTFADLITPLSSKHNKMVNVTSSDSASMPDVEIVAPRVSTEMGFESGEVITYDQGSLVKVLIRAESNEVVEVSEIMLLQNGVPVPYIGTTGITSSLLHDPNSETHAIGFYEFVFQANTLGLQNLLPVVVDQNGNQFVTTDEEITINVSTQVGSSPPVIQLVSPYKAEMGNTWPSSSDHYLVSEISQITVGSTIPVAAFARDADMDFESLQFFLGDAPISDPLQLPGDIVFANEYPYSMIWEANETGLFYLYAVGRDKSGNLSISNLSSILVLDRVDSGLQRPEFTGARQIAKATAVVNAGAISIDLTDGGYGYLEEPVVWIDNFNTDGNGSSARATINPETRTVDSIIFGKQWVGLHDCTRCLPAWRFRSIRCLWITCHCRSWSCGRANWSHSYKWRIWLQCSSHCHHC